MSEIYEVIRACLLDRDLPDERRANTESCLNLMTPLIAFCNGETELATADALPTKSACLAMAKLLQLDPKSDPVGFAKIGLVGVPLSQLETLPPTMAGYTSPFVALLANEFGRAPDFLPREDWHKMNESLFATVREPLSRMFGQHTTAFVSHFDDRMQSLMISTYVAALGLGTLYALNDFREGMMRVVPMLRIMKQIAPVGFPAGQGMKLHAFCRG